jgi:TonB-dependent SusC/RagA subfamily outer membrane receptor
MNKRHPAQTGAPLVPTPAARVLLRPIGRIAAQARSIVTPHFLRRALLTWLCAGARSPAHAAGAQRAVADSAAPRPRIVAPAQFVVDTVYGPAHVSRAAGWSVGIIDSATIASSPAHTLSDLLSARVAGVSVLRSSGVVGSGSRVRLRGANSFFGAREPIVVIDGVRIEATQHAHSLGTASQAPSRLDDIDLRDIARIEVLRGSAASALYGTDGAGGVIRITTVRPQRHTFSWNAFAEGNASLTATDYPANYSTGSGVGLADSCTRGEAALGSCAPGPLLGWNPLESATPFRTATRGALGVRAMGGVDRLGYLASASVRDEAGVLAPNDVTRHAARIALDAEALPGLRVTLDGAYWHSRVTLPLIDGQMPAVLLAGLEGNAVDDPVYRGYNAGDLPVPLDTPTEESVGRAVGSVSATWTPVQWLAARARAGGESLRGDDHRSTGTGGDSTRNDGSVVQRTDDRNSSTSVDASLTSTFQVTPALRSETTLGVEHLHRATYAADSSGIGSVFSYSQRWAHHDVTGLLASQRLAWQERRYVGVGVRRDRWAHDAFAPSTFFSADVTWVIGDEAFFPRLASLSQMRLRTAYGRTSDVRTFALAPPAFSPPVPGSPPPERPSGETISELEVGLDAFLFQRLWLDATWFRQHSGNALATCCFTGPALIGDWRTTGVDATLSASLVRSLRVDWTARLDVSAFSNRIDDAGLGRTSVAAGTTPAPRVSIRNGAGHPIAGVWGNPVLVRDENGDGIISDTEVAVDANAVYLGSSIPTREVSLSTTLALRRVSVSALVDYRGGFKQVNGTEAYRCELELCGALYDPGASLDDQGRAVAVFRAGAGFVEDASFVRLREIGVTWKLLPGWAYRRGLARFDLTIAARNLLTFTGYSGLDPEINYTGQSGLSRGDFMTFPLARTLILRLQLQR